MIRSLTCICFASIDWFVMSCRNVSWRQRSQLNTAKITIGIVILIIITINIPYLISFTIIEVTTVPSRITTRCWLINPALVSYGNYFLCPVLPEIVLIITGLLTYRNITAIATFNIYQTVTSSKSSEIIVLVKWKDSISLKWA